MTMADSPDYTTAAGVMRLLADIEQSSRKHALNLPDKASFDAMWDGLAYTVGGVSVVTAMSELSEMLPYPEQITQVPGAKPWMLGLANVRGNLMPVIDLQVYLGIKPVVPSKAARMLVVRMRGLAAGLLVPAVAGMRHFKEKQRMENARMNGALGAYVFDAFSIDSDIWPVFSLSALTADPEFRIAAG